MKKGFYTLIGCTLIALAFNLFLLPYDIVSSGAFGLGALISFQTNYDPALFIFIFNMGCILVAYFTLGKEKIKEYIAPGILIPLIIFLTADVKDLMLFDYLEYILAAIVGAFLTGVGYSLLYKEGMNVGGLDALQDAINSAKVYRTKTFAYTFEALLLIAALFLLSIEAMVYSLITILMIRTLATKSKVGISTSKTFFIITKKEEEVKQYIINELKHDLTEFNVKGGFSNIKSKIIMTAIDTKDYYRLREGVRTIDPRCFISIIDSYEVINKNLAMETKE